jgi:hypothetical protein
MRSLHEPHVDFSYEMADKSCRAPSDKTLRVEELDHVRARPPPPPTNTEEQMGSALLLVEHMNAGCRHGHNFEHPQHRLHFDWSSPIVARLREFIYHGACNWDTKRLSVIPQDSAINIAGLLRSSSALLPEFPLHLERRRKGSQRHSNISASETKAFQLTCTLVFI